MLTAQVILYTVLVIVNVAAITAWIALHSAVICASARPGPMV